MIVTAFYFFYFVVSRLNAIIRIHWIMIIIYIVFHIFDCFYIIIIYFVFFKNTSSQEYENLKYIGELENLIKGKFSNGKIKIVYDELAHSIIAERFKGFINFENKNISFDFIFLYINKNAYKKINMNKIH